MKQKMYLSFTDPETKDELLKWWESLDISRGDRAELRRCHSPLNVAFTPAYHRLRISLVRYGPVKELDLAVVAGVLSHVKTHKPGSFPIQMAEPGSVDGKKAKVSGLRFRRLLKIDSNDPYRLYGYIIRVVHLLGDDVDIPSLANSIYWWNERTKKDWAFDYYEHAPKEEQ